MKKTLAASALTVGMLAVPLAGSALADPTDTYPATYNGSGSDTTEVVMRALDGKITGLGSWDIQGGSDVPWDTNGTDPGCSFIKRPTGSGQGRTALANSVTKGDNCLQYARSSSRSNGVVAGTITGMGSGDGTAGDYTASTGSTVVPMLPITLATDGLTYVFRALSGTPRDLTLGQLRAIYHCNFGSSASPVIVDGRLMSSNSIPNQPLLPADASGSRSDWLKLMANDSSDIAAYTAGTGEVASDPSGNLPACIDDGPGDSPATEFSEHNGSVLTNGRQIILHSTAQWIAQGRSATGDARGLAQLGYINGNTVLAALNNAAGVLDPSTVSGSTITDGAYFRPVYNVLPTALVGDSNAQAVFGTRAGGTTTTSAGTNGVNDIPGTDSGAICVNDATIQDFGFLPVC